MPMELGNESCVYIMRSIERGRQHIEIYDADRLFLLIIILLAV